MITYQKHYNYIKRNFYENQENKVTEEEHEEWLLWLYIIQTSFKFDVGASTNWGNWGG